jgi:simple sugar transport system permease protein
MTATTSEGATAPSTSDAANAVPRSDRGDLFSRLLRFQEMAIALIGIALAIYFIAKSKDFATSTNAVTLSQYIAPIAFFALAEVFILILGEIDLSVGEVYVLAPFLVHYSADLHLGVIVGIIIALVVAALIGTANGLITVKLHVPSFITTLGTVFAIEGIILITSNGTQVNTNGSGRLASILGAYKYSEILWALGLALVLHIALRRTTFGLHVTAVGGNLVAASESGIRADRVKILCFVLCSTLGAVMGILDSYRIGSLDPSTDGLTLMFYGVAAAVIGGTALTGGRGTMIGALIGAIVLGILQDGFNITGVSAFAYTLVLGLAILGAMILNVQVGRLGERTLGRRNRPKSDKVAA